MVTTLAEARIVAVVPISTPALSSATGNVLAVRALETLEALRALRIRVAFASARLQVLCATAVAAAQLDVMATTVVVVGCVAEVRIVAVVPIFAAAVPSATGNLLALGALETLEAKRALRIRVAFASARLQVLCSAVVSAAQLDVVLTTELRMVAVVPIFAAALSSAAGNWLAFRTLETLQPLCALCIRVALAPTRLEVCGATIVFAAQDVAMATTVVVVVVGFVAEFRIVAVVPINTPALPSATGNLLAMRALETLEAKRTLRIRVAFAFARLQVLCFAVVSAAQHDVMAFTTEFRMVAVVPIFAAALPSAAGNWLAVRTLETLQPPCALCIRVALAITRLEVCGATVVRAAQHVAMVTTLAEARIVAVVPISTP